MRGYIGVDVGSVSTNIALLDETGSLVDSSYLRARGSPIEAVKEGMRALRGAHRDFEVIGAGATGSGRKLAGVVVGADVVKNEITAHAVAAMAVVPGVRTVIEIGGQDSKLIVLRSGIVVDFGMNAVCAAGTGSFLEHQAQRLGVPIGDFGRFACQSSSPVRIAGKCAVFAESDMVHKQQMGYSLPDILCGLCEALVRNYLSNVGKGKAVASPAVFQGGVAANSGMRRAFEDALGFEVIVPPHFDVMGAIGAAMLAQRRAASGGGCTTAFAGWEVPEQAYATSSWECDGCPNTCEVVEVMRDSHIVARWGGRCGKWERLDQHEEHAERVGSNESLSCHR